MKRTSSAMIEQAPLQTLIATGNCQSDIEYQSPRNEQVIPKFLEDLERICTRILSPSLSNLAPPSAIGTPVDPKTFSYEAGGSDIRLKSLTLSHRLIDVIKVRNLTSRSKLRHQRSIVLEPAYGFLREVARSRTPRTFVACEELK